MRSPLREVSSEQEGSAHEAMPDHEWDCRPFFLGEGQELPRELAQHVAVERHIVCDPKAVEHREQQRRVFRRLSERFSLFDEQTCALRSHLSFLCSITFDMHESVDERDLKLDLLTAQRGRGRQGRDLAEGTRELRHSLYQRRCPTGSRPSPSAPPRCSGAPAARAGFQRCSGSGYRVFRRCGREARARALRTAQMIADAPRASSTVVSACPGFGLPG